MIMIFFSGKMCEALWLLIRLVELNFERWEVYNGRGGGMWIGCERE